VSTQDSGQNAPFGIMMILISATSFGLLTTLARIAYDGGSNAITIALLRSVVAIVAGLAICLVIKRDWRIPRGGMRDVFWVSAGLTGMSVFYLGAVQYISVSLGAILFYTYPVLVLITEAILLREVPGRVRILVFLFAFGGLILALGPSFDSMDWRGIAFACGASASATLLFFATKRARRTVNETALIVWGTGMGLPVIIAVAPLMGGVMLPETGMGWSGAWLTCLFFVIALLAYTIGLRHVIPSRGAMYYNLEPVISVIAAGLLLSELLTPLQLTGAMLVLAALILSAWRERHQRGESPG